ncbi:MAG: DUF2062 domain-containing protein [Gammaproteobacteria bacterium]|nr:DUF2062 domain-containing protein [Gammaproteobacteria bacterium]MBU2477879.1 DUF2062 domain-containing protein [Gammaproteobacteria bacterium]
MPRRIIKRFLPDHGKLREHPHLRRFGARLQDGNLWHLNRRSVSGAVAVGLFCALLPLPFQMIIAAGFAIWWRVNLPISVALVWLTNPLTMPPVWYATYRLGALMLNLPPRELNFELSVHSMILNMQGVWKPLLLGSVVSGVVLAIVGFLLVRLAWRISIISQRRATLSRIKARLAKKQHTE